MSRNKDKMKITVELPEHGRIYGAWISTSKDSDVHVSIENDMFVIGCNPTYKGNNTFTDPALCIGKNGCSVQYRNEAGEVAWVDVDTKLVANTLLEMLHKLKES